MSNGDLISERRFRDWSLSHPRLWSVATDRTGACEFVSAQIDRVVRAQLGAADSIIVSQDRIASGIDSAVLGINRVAEGLESLAATFEWGFSELIWQIEEQRKVLQEILEVLQVPLDTQARELKKRAEDAYRNGWFEDALQDFLQSEKKNRYDFTIHQNLGNIYFFEKKNPEKALEYYKKAVKYATPKSPYYASIALLHVGLIRYLQGDFQKAYDATSRAVKLSPKLYEAHYQHAQYCANLSRYDEAIKYLWKAIEGDRYYCIKADSEKDFDVMKKQLRQFFKELRNRAQSQAESEIKIARDFIKEAESYDASIANKLASAKNELNYAMTFLKRRSLFDSWDAIHKARNAFSHTRHSFTTTLSKQIENLSRQIAETKKRISWWEKMDWEDPTWLSIPKWGSLGVLFIVLATFGLTYAITVGIPSAINLLIRGRLPSLAEINVDPDLAGLCYWAVVSSFVFFLVSWTVSFAVKRALSSRYRKSDKLKLKVLEEKLSKVKKQIRSIEKHLGKS